MPDTRPSLDDLKALAAALPPDHQVQGPDAAQVATGIAALLKYGRDIVDAAKQGGDGVYSFIHDYITANKPEGAEDPQRGYVHEYVQPAVGAAPAPVQEIDYDKLAAALVRAQRNAEVAAVPAPAETGEVTTGHASTGDTPAGADVAHGEVVTEPHQGADEGIL